VVLIELKVNLQKNPGIIQECERDPWNSLLETHVVFLWIKSMLYRQGALRRCGVTCLDHFLGQYHIKHYLICFFFRIKTIMNQKLTWIRFGIFLTAVLITMIGIYLMQLNNGNPIDPANTGIIVTSLGSALLGIVAITWMVQIIDHSVQPKKNKLY
jgi:hypothetical protein